MKNFLSLILLSATILTACKSKEQIALEQAQFQVLIQSKVDSVEHELELKYENLIFNNLSADELHQMMELKNDSLFKAYDKVYTNRFLHEQDSIMNSPHSSSINDRRVEKWRDIIWFSEFKKKQLAEARKAIEDSYK